MLKTSQPVAHPPPVNQPKTGCNGGVWESAGNKPTEELFARVTATTAGRVVGGGLLTHLMADASQEQ